MSIEIPKQLQQKEFRFIPLGKITTYINSKGEIKKKISGFYTDWDTINFPCTSSEIKNATNYGVVCNFGNLVVIDVDKKTKEFDKVIAAMEVLPKTFTVKTWSGGKHYYYICNDIKEGRKLSQDAGEIRFKGMMVIGANSNVDGKKYVVEKELPIEKISYDTIETALKNWLKKLLPIDATVASTVKETDQSNSGREWHEVCKLIEQGKTKEQVFQKMQAFSKWTTAPQKYRDHTYKKALEEVKKNKQPEPTNTDHILKPMTAEELVRTETPKDFVIDKLQRKGEIEMDYSEPAGLKSLLAMYRVLCVTTGKKFFGLKTQAAPALIIDNENSIPLLATRLRQMRRGMKIKKTKKTIYFSISDGQLDMLQFAKEVKQFIIEKKIGLIVIDTVRRIHSLEENSSTEMNELYKILKELITGTSAALLLLHHTNKQGEYRGSIDLKGMVDVQVKVERAGLINPKFTMENQKNRWGELEEKIHGQITFQNTDTSKGMILVEQTDAETAASEANENQQFVRCRGFIIQFIALQCPKDGLQFKKIDLTGEIDDYNEEISEKTEKTEKTLKTRTIEKVLNRLIYKKYLLKGEKKGYYVRNFLEKPHIFKWSNQFEGKVGNYD